MEKRCACPAPGGGASKAIISEEIQWKSFFFFLSNQKKKKKKLRTRDTNCSLAKVHHEPGGSERQRAKRTRERRLTTYRPPTRGEPCLAGSRRIHRLSFSSRGPHTDNCSPEVQHTTCDSTRQIITSRRAQEGVRVAKATVVSDDVPSPKKAAHRIIASMRLTIDPFSTFAIITIMNLLLPPRICLSVQGC